MAFDAHREDYQRLSLRFARTLTGAQGDNLREFASFGHQFATQRDSLPQTDADRAFHLVAEATTLIDYRLPMATDEEAETIDARARRLLDEALALDGHCHDALRMRQAADAPSIDQYYHFLCEHEEEVRARCERERAEAERDDSPERARLGGAIAMFPYLRWVAMLADKALVCGRNREALRHARKARAYDPNDIADLRFTCAYAHASLEDEQGFDQMVSRVGRLAMRPADDAWVRLARAYLAHARRDFAVAREQLAALVGSYPNAAVALARQYELPDGVFARHNVPPYSEDELVVAVSESTVLLREGRDNLGLGAFGSWVLDEALGMVTLDQLGEVRDLIELCDGNDGS